MFNNVMNRAKRFAPAVIGSSAFALGSAAKVALCEGVADTAVTGAFTGMGDNIVATMGTVAPYAIGVMACILGFKYGKKIFKVIANG
ncbi:hypothetical protein [Desulfosporosinus sp. BG]|uniref:hypothetical protein n=1 Tax=Desulfosporosinus sp. BG TaxID=1633135 RepID=UPI00083A552F|nr:hypothetical protein [Desulfosporosinus sp. BG]ODA41066.1 hypothetical protein DSBG_2104 [Desulfosporosinus sp. BG]